MHNPGEIGRLTRPIPDGRDGVSATAHAGQAGGQHQPGNTFATDTNAGIRTDFDPAGFTARSEAGRFAHA